MPSTEGDSDMDDITDGDDLEVIEEAWTDDGGASILEQALVYARYGLSIFPVHAVEKRPLDGYAWKELATCKINHVVEDFTRAVDEWGEDSTSVAWAAGLDRYCALDMDIPQDDWPTWVADVIDYAAINVTRRGHHLIFKNPAEFEPGNTDTKLPTKGWGEVRGAGGYIVIAGPDRPGFNVDDLDLAQPFPRPEWLEPYGGGADAVTWDEAKAFARQHTAASMPNKINGIRSFCDGWDDSRNGEPVRGRHPSAVWLATLIAEEALAGYYPYEDGLAIVKAWWERVTPPERHGRELRGMVCWGIGRALDKAAATASVDASPPDASDEDDPLSNDDGLPEAVDWAELWATDFGDHQWSVEGFWPRGRSMSLNAGAKTGKSEVALHVVTHLVRGIHPWTGERIEPQRVMYLDFEMTPEDLIDRLSDFGYDDTIDLSGLRYYLLPTMPPLNTEQGGRALMRLVDRDQPDVVVLDTFSRIYSGDENANADIQAFYRYAGLPLKRRSVGVLRLDHMGKDKTKGARGASAKNDDIDVAWELERSGGGHILKRTHTRVSWVPERIDLQRSIDHNGTVRYMTPSAAHTPDRLISTGRAVHFAQLAMPKGLTKRQATEWLRARGESVGRSQTLVDALRLYNAGAVDDVPAAMAADDTTPPAIVNSDASTTPSTTPVDSDGE